MFDCDEVWVYHECSLINEMFKKGISIWDIAIELDRLPISIISSLLTDNMIPQNAIKDVWIEFDISPPKDNEDYKQLKAKQKEMYKYSNVPFDWTSKIKDDEKLMDLKQKALASRKEYKEWLIAYNRSSGIS